MKLLGIEVTKEFHIKVKVAAASKGKTLKQYVLDLIAQDLNENNNEKG